MSPADELALLLSEDAGVARVRAQHAFDDTRGGRPVVLVGAGNLGRRAAAVMRAAGDAPVAFADRSASLIGHTIDGIPVLSVDDVVRRHSDAVFVVTIWGARSSHRIAETHRDLAALGVSHVAPFAHVFWRYAAVLPHYLIDLPHTVLEQRAAVTSVFGLFTEDRSRVEFVAQVRARLTGEVHRLNEPIVDPQYLVAEIVAQRTGESVVDGGAFDGDTLASWVAHRGAFASWTAFEPHPDNAAAFAKRVAALPAHLSARVTLYTVALGAKRGTTTFDATPSAGAAARDAGGITVPVVRLDETDLPAPPTFIKLDIEGAELDAIAGMAHTIARARPAMAVCVYHRQDHLWRVPSAIAEACDECEFILRPHGAEGWDLVCYAVPRERRA